LTLELRIGKSEIEKMETGTRKPKNGDGMKFYLTK